MKKFLAILALLVSFKTSFADESYELGLRTDASTIYSTARLIKCKSEESSPLFVELWKPSEFGELLHCVKGDFVADMTSCAPDGGWGLSRGTGLAGLSEITSSWQVAFGHRSGKMSANIGMTSLWFTANHGEGIGDAHSFQWELDLDRVTGGAELRVRDKKTQRYSCEIVKRKF